MSKRKQGAGYLFSDGSKILLLKRNHTETYPRTWCLPGGHSEEGERPEETARRELREETGVYRPPGTKIETLTSRTGQFEFHCILWKVDTHFKVRKLSKEHSAWMWVEIGELPRFPLHPALKRDMPKYLRALRRRIKPSFKEWLDIGLSATNLIVE